MIAYYDSGTIPPDQGTEATAFFIYSTEIVDELADLMADIKDLYHNIFHQKSMADFELYLRWVESKIRVMCAMIRGFVRTDYPRRMLISKSGFLGRTGRKRKN